MVNTFLSYTLFHSHTRNAYTKHTHGIAFKMVNMRVGKRLACGRRMGRDKGK